MERERREGAREGRRIIGRNFRQKVRAMMKPSSQFALTCIRPFILSIEYAENITTDFSDLFCGKKDIFPDIELCGKKFNGK